MIQTFAAAADTSLTFSQVLIKLSEIWVSPAGAAIFVPIPILVGLILLIFSSRLREFATKQLSRSFRRKKGEDELEVGAPLDEKSTSIEGSHPVVGISAKTEDVQEAPEVPVEDDDSLFVSEEQRFIHTMIRAAFTENDREALRTAYEHLKALPEKKISDESLETLKLNLELRAGFQDAETALKEIEESNPSWILPSIRLAEYYLSISSLEYAESHVKIALERANNPLDIIQSKELLADIQVIKSKSKDAIEDLERLQKEIEEPDLKARVLQKLADVYEKINDKQGMHFSLERALTHQPSDKSCRFRLAYSYAQQEESRLLSLWHYNVIRNQDSRHSATLNNISVIYEQLGLPGKQIQFLKRASEIEKGIASANLAVELIKAGFFEEAKDCLLALPNEEKIQSRAVRAMELLKEKMDTEDEQKALVEKTAKVHHDTVVEATVAFSDPTLREVSLHELIGEWKSPNGDSLNFVEMSMDMTIKGATKKKASGLAGLLNSSAEEIEVTGRKDGVILRLRGLGPQPQTLLSIREERHFYLVIKNRDCLTGYVWEQDALRAERITFIRQ